MRKKENYINLLFKKYPILICCKAEIEEAVKLLIKTVQKRKNILVCGNGGSAADADHIVGELLKGFLNKRALKSSEIERLNDLFPEYGSEMALNLQQGISAISLASNSSFITAFSNDLNPEYIFAQQVYTLGKEDDILICISTSGNSKNIIKAAMIAKLKNIKVIGLTGKNGGDLKKYCGITIKVPFEITYEIQEYHLPVYHAICAEIENELFNE